MSDPMNEPTVEYAQSLGKMLLDPSYVPPGGRLSIPGDYVASQLFNQEGSTSLSFQPTTTSAVVVFDAEASTRNGQCQALIMERNASKEVTKLTTVKVGAKSDDFLSAGVVSSSMMCRNTSGEDFVSGTQTAGVVYSAPQLFRTLDASDVHTIIVDRDRDLVSSLASKTESTYTVCPTNHLGRSVGLCRPGTSSNRSMQQHTYMTDYRNTSLGTDGFVLGSFRAPDEQSSGLTSWTDPNGVKPYLLFDTRLATTSPLNFATYGATVTYNGTVGLNSDATFNGNLANAGQFQLTYYLAALDAAGAVLDILEFRTDPESFFDGSSAGAPIRGTWQISGTAQFKKDLPIADVCLGVRSVHSRIQALAGDAPEDGTIYTFEIEGGAQTKLNSMTVSVEGVEETSDIPLRPIHMCIFEGVNSNATITVHCGACVNGVPSSANAFLAGRGVDTNEVDMNQVEKQIKTLSDTMSHTYTYRGFELSMKLYASMPSDTDVQVLGAMSSKTMKKGFQKLKKVAKAIGNEYKESELRPLVEGAMKYTVPGGDLMMEAAQMGAGAARRYNRM